MLLQVSDHDYFSRHICPVYFYFSLMVYVKLHEVYILYLEITSIQSMVRCENKYSRAQPTSS